MLEHIYEFEKQYLSPYACHSQNTKGRQFETTKSELRTEFQRDRDRIIHSKALNAGVFISKRGPLQNTSYTYFRGYASCKNYCKSIKVE